LPNIGSESMLPCLQTGQFLKLPSALKYDAHQKQSWQMIKVAFLASTFLA